MQNSTFFVLLRPIFAPRMKTAPPPPKDWEPKLWRSCRCLDQNSGVFWFRSSPKVGENLFYLEITDFGQKNLGISDFGRKNPSKFGEDFFFGVHLNLTEKTTSISFKTSNENLGQVRLRWYQTSKKAHPPLCEILATRLHKIHAVKKLCARGD